MPISIDSFQRTLDTSKIQGFVKLSDNGTSVKSYGGGFFARHFGLYSKPSVEENNAVRRAFYESVMDTYHCKGEVLTNLRRELGIDENGISASGQQLGVREAKDILQRIKTAMAEERTIAKDMDNGQPFDITLKRAFKDAMCEALQPSLDLADKTDTMPDMNTAFESVMKDLHRAGTGLKLGNTVVSRANESTPNSIRQTRNDEMVRNIEQFFAADPTNGMRAGRIISDIVHQGFMATLQQSINMSHEPCDIFFNADMAHIMDFSVSRSDEGSYKIGYEGFFSYRLITKDGEMKVFDPSKSGVHFNVNLTLSFDSVSGKPKIDIDQPPKMTGQLTLDDRMGMTEFSKIQNLVDPTDGTNFEKGALLSGELSKPEVMEAVLNPVSPESTLELVRSRVLTKSDMEILNMLNIGGSLATSMMARFAADETTPHLGKEIIGRLLEPSTREAAIQDLKKMAQPIVDKGWTAQVPDFQPELLNLVTIGGLSHTTFAEGLSDASLVANFIRNSDNPDVKRLPAELKSDRPATVAAAKEQVKALALTLRHELGLKLLCTYMPEVGAQQCELLARYIPQDRCNEMLQHIVHRDPYMNDAIRFFESNLQAAYILDKG